MKRFPFYLIPVLLLMLCMGACTSRTERSLSALDELLKEIKEEYAPDDRLEWWEIEAVPMNEKMVVKGDLTSKKAYQVLKDRLNQDFPDVSLEVLLLPEGHGEAVVNGLVNNSVIHLRREPSSTKELITQARLGAPVRILKESGGKSLIQVADGYIGWVNTAEVHPLDEEGLSAYRDAEKVIYSPQYGMSYSEPDPESLPVTDLVTGNILVKVSELSGFTQLLYPDGRLGWVKSNELLPAKEVFYQTTLGENLVQTALKFHGIPYLWGGTSSKNIDCSGLVCNVYFMNGMQLPRDADMQALIGRELTTEFEYEMLEPGDLLFFGRKATEENEENVTHVAIYMGGGEYIHSAGYRERVSINSMDSTQEHFIERYPEIFVRAVRILGEEYEGFSPIPQNAFYKQIISQES